MNKRFKNLIQNAASFWGYQIQKKREYKTFPAINVFDLVIQNYLKNAESSEIIFVQIGANDGKRADPLYPYIKKYHWQGLLIEPQPKFFKKLRETYQDEKQLLFENVIISHENGAATLYTIKDTPGLPEWCYGIASLDRDCLLSNQKKGLPDLEELIEEIRLPSITLSTLLSKHDFKSINILQIDVEGYDFEILKMVDFTQFRPAIIQYEHFHLTPEDQVACLEYLTHYGYSFAQILGDTIAYYEQSK